MDFENVQSLPDDLARLSDDELNNLCTEIRKRLVEVVSKNGGHLASNLGVVELTVALYSVYNPHRDRIVWDVGHQSYVHKILTGRNDALDLLRHPGGAAGFPKRSESDADAFNVGHSSTSVSAALGYARAYKLTGDKRNVLAVIGDGALTGGMAYEALNDAAQSRCNIKVVLNDNGMSIDRNVGGLSKYLGRIRKRHSYMKAKRRLRRFLFKIPKIGRPIAGFLSKMKNRIKHIAVEGKFFEDLGFYYLGPVDGHDIFALKLIFERANEINGPVLIHVQTQKGRGYEPAENSPDIYHGLSGFDAETGEVKKGGSASMSGIFSDTLAGLAENDGKIVAVTAAMSKGTGLDSFAEKFPERFVDVGIAEEHAVTMSAGLSAAGMKPVTVIYSTFLQRAYDQLLHDIIIQKLPAVIGVDRAGVCGYDGETHHGIYDLAYLGTLPGGVVAAPSSGENLRELLRLAIHVYDPKGEESFIPDEYKSLFAIRYPARERFTAENMPGFVYNKVEFGKGSICFEGGKGEREVLIISIGEVLGICLEAAKKLCAEGYKVTVFDARFLKPLDSETMIKLALQSELVITVEDGISGGGFGEKVRLAFSDIHFGLRPMKNIALPESLIENDSVSSQLEKNGISCENILKTCRDFFVGWFYEFDLI